MRRTLLKCFGAGSVVSYFVPLGGIRNGWKVRDEHFGVWNSRLTFIIEPHELCIVLENTTKSPIDEAHIATYLLVRNEIIVYFENKNNLEEIWTADGR